jgi:hypothetical protein
MPLIDFTTSFVGGPSFYTGTGVTDLVPSQFPVALNGRPYLLDLRSNRFSHQFEQRVRDQSDISTAPGEASINPQGLWRRGSKSWHLGAGQLYADDADAQDYRFSESKGVDVWKKGQLSLLNDTELSLASTETNLMTCTVISSAGVEYLYVADGKLVKFTTDPFASSPTWTTVTTNTAGGDVPDELVTGLETNGVNVFIGWADSDIWYTTPGSTSATLYFQSGTGSGSIGNNKSYTSFGYAKNRGWAAVDNYLFAISPIPTHGSSTPPTYTNPDPTFRWVGAAAGQNAVYVAGAAGEHSIIFKITITSAGVLDTPVAALELPVGEVVSSIHGYLGFILLGTNRGVRFCSTDTQNNLVAGPLIPTSGPVYDFTEQDRFVWFTWSDYDGSSGGLGRLDLSRFTGNNAPAYATDLMYSDDGAVKSVSSFDGRRVFTIAGVGVVAEDRTTLVPSGSLETGIYTWGIPDKKFIPRFDIRFNPLIGSVSLQTSYNSGAFTNAGTFVTQNQTEHTFLTSQDQVIEAGYRLVLTRATTATGPVVTRWMARAYAAPRRSQIITLPVLLHELLRVENNDFYLNVEQERNLLENLVDNPRIVIYQERNTTYSVIVEDVEWLPIDTSRPDYIWEGTAVITMRTVAE